MSWGPRAPPVSLNGRELPFFHALFANDAVCFLGCSSRSLAFHGASGATTTMGFPAHRVVDRSQRAFRLTRSLDRLQRPGRI